MINGNYREHIKILFWGYNVERQCERHTERKRKEKEIWKDKETGWTSLEVTRHQLLLKWATKTRESSIYSVFPIWFLIHILQITLNDETGKATL